MIIETEEYRDLLRAELEIFRMTDELAAMNKRYAVKSGVLVVQGTQIVCGGLASFRASHYHDEWNFHPESTVIDMYSADIDVTFFISKLNMKNEAVKSRPCVKCMREIRESHEVKAIYYRDEDLKIVKEVIQ